MKIFTRILSCLFLFSQLAVADLWTDFSQYTFGSEGTPASEAVHDLILKTPASEMAPIEEKLIEVLTSSTATKEAKWYSLRMLTRIGSEACVPVLSGLLGDDEMAAFALGPFDRLTDSTIAGDALLKALDVVPDHLKTSIMNSLVTRGDQAAVAQIAPYVASDNMALAKAALFALSQLGGADAKDAIRGAPVDAAKTAARVERASELEDPGTFYFLQKGSGPVGAGYVSSNGTPGWKGEYFANNEFSGAPAVERIDSDVNFNWKHGAPADGMPKDNFSVRWTGTLTPPETRDYAFTLHTDDGVSLKIDGEALLDNLGGGYRGTVFWPLEAGKSYAIEMKFIEGGGEAIAKLSWDCANPETMDAAATKIEAVTPIAKQRALIEIEGGLDVRSAETMLREGLTSGVRIGAFLQLVDLDATAAKRVMVPIIKNKEDPIRGAVLRAAMEQNPAGARGALISALPTLSPADQRVLLGAISNLSLTDAEKDVLALLKETDSENYHQVVYTLGSIGGLASFEPLYEAYKAAPSEAVAFAITQLPVPSVDAHLLKVVASSSGAMDERLSAIMPLVLRNPEGISEVLAGLVAPDQDPALRKAGFKAMEAAGTVDSCRVLADLIVNKDPMARTAQITLKRLSLRLDRAYDIWDAAFKPAMTSAPDDASREALIAVLDGIPTGATTDFLRKTILDRENPLRNAALKSLSRWPQFHAAKIWLAVATDEASSEKEIALAQKGIVRLLTSETVREHSRKKIEFARIAVDSAPTPEFKQAIVACYEDRDRRYDHGKFRETFRGLSEDPVVGPQIQAILK